MNELKKREMGSFALSQGGTYIVTTLVGTFLNAFYTDTIGIAAAAVGTMMLILRVFDGVTDLLMGAIIDRTHTKYGKAKPWVLVSAPFLAIALVLVYNFPESLSDGGKLVYAYLTYFFLSGIVSTVYQVSDNALIARMTLDPQKRQTMTSVSQIFSGVVTLIISSYTAVWVEMTSWKTVSIIYGILAALCAFVGAAGVKEHVGEVTVESKKAKQARRESLGDEIKAVLSNRYFIGLTLIFVLQQCIIVSASASMIYYCRIVLGDVGGMAVLGMASSIPMIIINFILPMLVKRFTKQKCMMGASVVLIVAFFLCGISGRHFVLAVIGTCLRSLGIGVVMACAYAFTGDVVDYGDYQSGIRTEGMTNSGVSFGLKVGVGLGSAIGSWILAAGGYVGTAEVQTASAVFAVKVAFGYINLVLAVLLLIVCAFMNVEKKQREIRKELENRYQKITGGTENE